MDKYISDLDEEKVRLGNDDFFIIDNSIEEKSYKVRANVLLPIRKDFVEESTIWLVEHNLGRYPIITTFLEDSTQIEGDILYLDENSFRVSFLVPLKGFIIFQ